MKHTIFALLLLFSQLSFAQYLKKIKHEIFLTEKIVSLTFNSQTTQLLIGGAKGKLEIFNSIHDSTIDAYSFNGRINQLIFNQKEDYVALCTSQGKLSVWKISKFVPITSLNLADHLNKDTPENNKNYLQEIITIAWGRNDQELYFAGNSGIIYRLNINRPNHVEEWVNLKRGDVIPKITDLALTPDGKTLLVCAGKIIGVPLNNPQDHKELFDIDVKDFSTLAIYPSPRGHQLVAWSYFSKKIYFWEDYRLKENYKTRQLSRQPFASRMKFLDENIVISGTQDSGLVIFDLKKDSILQYRNDHTDKVFAIEVSKDKKYVFSGGYDKKLNIYEVDYKKADNTNSVRMASNSSTYELLQSIKHLWFIDDSHKYRDTSLAKKEIAKLYNIYQRDTSTYILLDGYTNVGKNLQGLQLLSRYRAKRVRDDLIKTGIPSNKIIARGHGPRQLSTKDKESGRINMRVEISLMSQDALKEKQLKRKGISAKQE